MVIFQLFVVALQFAASFFLYSSLPNILPTHWNIYGNIDGYMSKQYAAWLFPLLGLFMLISFKLAPSFDPKKEKYHLFATEWQILQTILIMFFAYIQGITFYAAFYPSVLFMKPLFIGMGVLFILLGNYLSKIRQNYFIGIKVPWTLNNEDNWNKTHRFASWTFVGMGMVVIMEAFFFWQAAPVIFGSIFLAVLLPVLYSYLLFKKKQRLVSKNKIIP